MSTWNRRRSWKPALRGAAAALSHAATAVPALTIARYKNPPLEPDGIAEEARRLTRQAIDALAA